MKRESRWYTLGMQVLAVFLALVFTTIVLLMANAQPFEAYRNILRGSFDSIGSITNVIVAWIPLLLASIGALVTFSAGLWNIGIEGQITMGAIATTFALRLLQDSGLPPALIIIIGVLAGFAGGALWAAIVGALKTYGGVNEIFGGLGMNFVATAMTIWLIFGPWKRPGIGSMSGTEPFKEELWLPIIEGLRLSWWSVIIGVLALVIVYFILSNTYFGLKLKAVGKNRKAASILGIPTSKYMMAAFMICGGIVGLAGGLQVLAVHHRLIPSISSGYGYLGLMVGMLVNYQVIWAAPVAFFFAALNFGSIQLPIVMKLDSSLSGVLQGALVLFVLMMDGIRKRLTKKA